MLLVQVIYVLIWVCNFYYYLAPVRAVPTRSIVLLLHILKSKCCLLLFPMNTFFHFHLIVVLKCDNVQVIAQTSIRARSILLVGLLKLCGLIS